MRITVVHNSQGEISALVASSPDAPPAHMELPPGQRMTEVEAPEETLSLESPQLNERLSDLMRNNRVEVQDAKGRLTAKSDRLKKGRA
jgi:hypothetical protein